VRHHTNTQHVERIAGNAAEDANMSLSFAAIGQI